MEVAEGRRGFPRALVPRLSLGTRETPIALTKRGLSLITSRNPRLSVLNQRHEHHTSFCSADTSTYACVVMCPDIQTLR